MKDIINKQTLPEQIYQILRKDILTQQIRCGTKLTLKDLKERFGVSHTPIREALTRLSDDNLITYYSNIGVRVVAPDEKDIREIFELNADLDCLALSYAFRRGNKEALLRELEENLRLCRQYLHAGDLDRWRPLTDEFHLALYNHAGNDRLDNASSKQRAMMTLLYNIYDLENKKSQVIQDYHERIFAAIRNDGLDLATGLLQAHLTEDLELLLQLYRAGQQKADE